MRIAVASVRETQQLESELIAGWGFPALLAMEHAALGVALAARRACGPTTPVTVLAGRGNNGADGVAAARLLKRWDLDPLVYLLPGPHGAALEQQLAWAVKWGVRVATTPAAFPAGGVVIDALYGSGLNRAPEGPARETIELLNRSQSAAVISVDLPSGLDGSTGVTPGAVVRASMSVACGVLKTGLLTDSALEHVGELYLAELGFPRQLLDGLGGDVLVPHALPPFAPAAHKGDAGFVLVVGGSAAMSGAPAMVSIAAGRIGAGLVYAAVPRSIRAGVAALMPEAVVFGLPEDAQGGLCEHAWDELAPLLSRCDAAVVGPGLGRGDGARAIVGKLWRQFEGPMVVDADALQAELLMERAAAERILTPHPGELARLLDCGVPAIQADRFAAAGRAAERFEAITVLKGARTIVRDPHGSYGVNVTGHPAMATAGSGDVLAGMIGGLLAQGVGVLEAARQGVALHGLCGEAAVQHGNARSILALDLVQALSQVLPSLTTPCRPSGTVARLSHLVKPWLRR